VIEPASSANVRLQDLWEYRDLFYLLVKRDITVRYRQTVVGAAWAVLQPAALAVVFSVFLGRLARVPSQGSIPYPLYAFSGIVLWLFFTGALSRSAESTLGAADLISKVWFPRVIIPMSAAIAPAIDFGVSFAVVLAVMLAYGYVPHVEVLLVPVVALLVLSVAIGMGLWFSALIVRYRDVRHLVPFLLSVGMFVTPIVYPFALVPDSVRPVYALNPMVGVLELYRWSLFGTLTDSWWIVVIPLVTALLLVISGLRFFRRAQLTFADVI